MIKFKKHREMEYRGLLIELVKLLQPAVYCEIGVKKGYTFNAIAPLVNIAIGIDPAGFNWYPDEDIRKYDPKDGAWYLYNKEWNTYVYLAHMTSDKYAESKKSELSRLVRYDKIDFLFIDGDHSAEQVKKDLTNFLPFVQEDTGLVFLHDIYPVKSDLAVKGYCHDAWKVGKWLSGNSDYEFVVLPGPWAGLGILRKKGKKYIPWLV